MSDLLGQYINKMLEFEEKGYLDEALELSNKMLDTFVEDKLEILFERGKLQFRNANYQEALTDFIYAYQISNDPEIYELVLEAYLYPNQENLILQYQENLKLLENYPHYKNEYPQEEELHFYPIFQNDQMVACVDTQSRTFEINHKQEIKNYPEHGNCYMMFNELWSEDILKCEEMCRILKPFLDINIPMYLVYDKLYWLLFLQLQDVTAFIESKRMVFLVGEKAFREYLSDTQVIMPNRVQDEKYANYIQALSEVTVIKYQYYNQGLEKIHQYYFGNKEMIDEHIKSGKPKILFMTSRFTTVLQYHTRDCMEAAQTLGCETELVIAPDGIRRVTDFYTVERLAEFKPDIIFCIDHFRYEHLDIPSEIIWITWVQDPLSHIMDKVTPGKLTDRDFIMNHLITWKKFFDVGYPQKLLIDAPIPANQHIYKPYQLTDKEKEEYACDICFVCHASDVDSHIVEELRKYPQELWDAIAAIYKGYQSFVYETGKMFYCLESFEEYIKGCLAQNYQIELRKKSLEYITNDMYQWFNQRVFRQALVDWILDAGFTNIKLWGNGWSDNEKYREYAMGPAENGETLSKIYQASKIVIGNNVQTTAAARAWESMLSGAFYMSNYIPIEADAVDIRKIVKVDEDVIMFYDREDLLEKIHFYLENENERQKMIERGRKVTLEKMTFDKLIERTIEIIGKKLEE